MILLLRRSFLDGYMKGQTYQSDLHGLLVLRWSREMWVMLACHGALHLGHSHDRQKPPSGHPEHYLGIQNCISCVYKHIFLQGNSLRAAEAWKYAVIFPKSDKE